jgi:ATP-dependent HslUV protease ATP-binding subunit HslU
MTTIVLVRKNNEVVVAGDGQVSMGNTVVKSTASKIRKIEKRDVVAGFAGSTADALTLFERLEAKIEKHAGNLSRAAVELAKDWRTDKYLRRLEALMAIGDKENSYIISGTGDVLEPEGDVIGIGSGGNYALAAGKVLMETDKSAEEIAKKAIKVASEICVFTNDNIKVLKNIMENSNVTPLVPKDKNTKEESSLVSSLSPREIVSELDRFVVGQNKAKKAVAVALRNRWRRQALKGEMKNEVLPKNILMIGPTGVGKTEISRRLSKLAEAPFVKVEATRFTEVGYVGRDVEQIVRDLIEIAIGMEKVKMRKEVHAQAQKSAEEKVLDALVGKKASLATRESFRKRLRNGDLDDNEIEIAVSDTGSNNTSFEIPGMPGANVGMINIGEMIGKSMGSKEKKKKMTVKESHEILINDESDKLIEQDKIVKAAKLSTENNGIVFLDEIDKISARTDRVGGDVSREGVQRDLLPLIEGTTVNTKHGPIKTDHILFIASGAFQLAKPSDLLPELQGRLPIRVELEALTSDDFKRILREPDFSLIKQYVALLKTENVDLEFSDDGIDTIANIASEVNATVENIGARRLHTIIEKILDEISFTATDRSGEKIIINKEYIDKNLDNLVKDTDLSKFIL